MRALTITSGYDAEYVDGILALIRALDLAILVITTIVGAVLSSFIVRSMVDKHFVSRLGLIHCQYPGLHLRSCGSPSESR